MWSFARSVLASLLVTVPLACGDDEGSGGAGGGTATSTVTSTTTGPTSTTATTSSGAGGAGGSGGNGGGPGAPFTSIGASSFETQTTLATDGDGGIVVVWVALFTDSPSAVGYAVSRDGGASFTAPAYLAAPDDRLSTNPVVVADSQGRFTLAWLGFRLDFAEPDEHVYVSRLDEASETFGAPAVASDDGTSTTTDFDFPSLAVDANDDVLVTFANFTGFSQGTPASLVFGRSSDLATFERATIVNDATFGNLANLCVDTSAGPSAPLYLVHLGAGGTVALRKSTDQGESWQLQPATPAANVVFQAPTCVVSGSSLAVAYASGDAVFSPSEDSPADAVEVMVSSTGGSSFGAPAVVTEAGVEQYLFPRIARGPTGKLEVAYYQGVVNDDATFVHASSTNGTSWTRAPIAPAGTFAIDLTLASWLGAYVGLAVPADTGFVSFTENTQGKTHIAFAEIALP